MEEYTLNWCWKKAEQHHIVTEGQTWPYLLLNRLKSLFPLTHLPLRPHNNTLPLLDTAPDVVWNSSVRERDRKRHSGKLRVSTNVDKRNSYIVIIKARQNSDTHWTSSLFYTYCVEAQCRSNPAMNWQSTVNADRLLNCVFSHLLWLFGSQ